MEWHPTDAAWQYGLARLTAYRNQHGHARVPVNFVDADGYRLGKWVARQRMRRSQSDGRRGLSHAQTAALDALDMVWRA